MSRLHNPDNLIRDKDRDFLGDDGHYWFSFLCPSESRADEDHRHVYQVRDDGEVAFCTCPYATNGGACTLILCARDVARRARAVDEPPPADPGGAALDAAPAVVSREIAEWTATMPATRRLDVRVAVTNGAWIQSYTAAGVRLTCSSCHDVRGWATEAEAADWLATDGRCRCGGGGPTPPAHGVARKPLQDHLDVLYGGE